MTVVENATKPYLGLKLLMEKHGYTQQEMADKLKMNKSTFNGKVNRTKGRDFSLSEADAISKILDEPMSDFFYN